MTLLRFADQEEAEEVDRVRVRGSGETDAIVAELPKAHRNVYVVTVTRVYGKYAVRVK